MPDGTRELVDALRMRRPYKVLLEVSARAGKIFSLLDALFWDQPKRRRVEMALAASLDAALEIAVAATRRADRHPQAGKMGDGCPGQLQPSPHRHDSTDELGRRHRPASQRSRHL